MHQKLPIHPPKATKKDHLLEKHGHRRNDPYYWLNERQSPEVIAYLESENAYYNEATAHTKEFQEVLFQEMKGRIKEDDESVPYKYNGYWYITRYEVGHEYPIYSRKKGSLDAPEEILFDCNEMARDYEYFHLRGVNISPDNRYAAFGVDTVSRRQYKIQIKDLETGEILPDHIDDATGSSVWGNDNQTLFYTKKDTVTLRSDRIFRHVLGTPTIVDTVVFHEEDETFSTYVYKTKSEDYVVIGSSSTLTTEYQILDANDPRGDFKLFSPRERGVEYSLYHFEDRFYVLTNKDDATNFKLMVTSETNTHSEHWQEFIPHREDILLEDLDIFKEFYVLSERENGLNKIKIVRWDGKDAYYLPFDNETYTAYTSINVDYDTTTLRYVYNAMTTPSSVIDFDMVTKEKTIKKEQQVLDPNFKKENYTSERIWATASDGVQVPISLVYKKGMALNGTAPLLLYGYGSYGSTVDPSFSSTRLSLLDRGFIFAIAHVRGGEYLGRPWYEDGKLLKKQNTFTDFIDCSQHLITQGYTSPKHLYALGGSAGGLLVGAVINSAPQLFNGIIAAVPFVDVVTTMLDDSIPLTTGEYDEWGNPNEGEYYHYMLGYSPYDNVKAQDYPNLLVTTGLHDSQVQYFEPAKWVAKLREMKTDQNLLLMEINMEAGHGGASGRFESLRELVKEYTFLLDLEGKIPN